MYASTSGPPGLQIDRLRDGDTRTVERVFGGLSPASLFLRFGTGMSRLPPAFTARLAMVDPGRQGVLVATVRGRPVGLGRWTVVSTGAAEVSVEVADAWQGGGVGRSLLRAVAADADDAGIARLVAYAGPENDRVLGWLARLGALRPVDGDHGHLLAIADLLDLVVVA